MSTISLCMIVKDEEQVLARCLESVKDAVDEIIIIDTGSIDNTRNIAKKYTDKIYNFKWVDDFSAARNFAFSKATMDYQMWLDADDVVLEDTLKQLLEFKNTLNPGIDIVTMKYVTHFNANGAPIHFSTRERLLRRERGYLWQDPVHEVIPLDGNVVYSDMVVYHKPIVKRGRSDRNIKIYTALENSGKELTPRQLYYFARELKDHAQWTRSAYYHEKFLNSGRGWTEDNIAACFNLSVCYQALKDEDKVLPILFKSFEYDSPRAEICSEIGYYYKRASNFHTALKWFLLATKLDTPNSIGFIQCDYWGYIPYIEACVCASHLGDLENAKIYNERAAEFKPHAPAVQYNRAFFSQL